MQRLSANCMQPIRHVLGQELKKGFCKDSDIQDVLASAQATGCEGLSQRLTSARGCRVKDCCKD